MIWALFNDIIQRVLTFNKWEQREQLSKYLKSLNLPFGSKALDFGCGTGLFAMTFRKENLNYYGYDIDEQFVSYASFLYSKCKFTTSINNLEKEIPFDLIVTNCCFHHIDDQTLSIELSNIKRWLDNKGAFLMIDLLKPQNDSSILRRMFRKLEKGEYLRTLEDYKKILEQYFNIKKIDIEKSHLFSLKNNPIFNYLVIFKCKNKNLI